MKTGDIRAPTGDRPAEFAGDATRLLAKVQRWPAYPRRYSPGRGRFVSCGRVRDPRAFLASCRLTGVVGWGTWIRTKTNRVRVCCATVTPFPNGIPRRINALDDHPGKSLAAGSGQITARWRGRSTRLILSLASAEAQSFSASRRPRGDLRASLDQAATMAITAQRAEGSGCVTHGARRLPLESAARTFCDQ